jgi:hypothetical protein
MGTVTDRASTSRLPAGPRLAAPCPAGPPRPYMILRNVVVVVRPGR